MYVFVSRCMYVCLYVIPVIRNELCYYNSYTVCYSACVIVHPFVISHFTYFSHLVNRNERKHHQNIHLKSSPRYSNTLFCTPVLHFETHMRTSVNLIPSLSFVRWQSYSCWYNRRISTNHINAWIILLIGNTGGVFLVPTEHRIVKLFSPVKNI